MTIGAVLVAGTVLIVLATATGRAAATEPIKLTYVEGDYAGAVTIWSEDGKHNLGFISYRQHRQGDRLHIERVARFRDGSSDEDVADVRVADRLEAVGGRSITRDTRGKPTVDLHIDVIKRHINGFYVADGKRQEFDRDAEIGPATYWGPLFNLVVKNFAANATDNKAVVQSILITPQPRVMDMELVRDGSVTVRRSGGRIKTDHIALLPTVNFIIDPILHRFVPKTEFFVAPGDPPALVRYSGPRNYAGQMVRLE